MDRIAKEMDLTRFVRKQLMLNDTLTTLFSKAEMYMLRNSRKFLLRLGDSGNDSGSEIDLTKFDALNVKESNFTNKILSLVTVDFENSAKLS